MKSNLRFRAFADGILHAHQHLAVVAGEHVVHQRTVGLAGEEAYHGHEDQSGDHAERAGVDGRLQQHREAGSHHGVGKHDHGGEHEARPHAGHRHALPVQAVEERGEECAGQSAPAHAHELRDEGDVGAVLHDGQNDGDEDEHHNQHAHDEQLLLFIQILHQRALDEVQRQRGGRRQHQRGQRGHGGRQHQNDHDGDQERREAGEHGGDDGVEAVRGHIDLVGEQAAESAQEVAAAGHDEREHRGDDHALVDGLLILDGVELLHHLGQSPRTQRGEDDHAQQIDGIGAEEGGEHAGRCGHRGIAHLTQLVERLQEAALTLEHSADDRADAHDHDQALNEVVDGGGHVAAGDDVHAGKHGHDDDAHGIVDVKRHAEQAAQAVVQGRGVGDEEDEDDRGRGQLERLAVEAFFKELGHGGAVQMLRHHAGAAAQHRPRQQRTQNGVANARPRGGDAVFPAELSGITHKHHGGEIAGAIGESGQPRADAASAEYKAVYVRRVAAAIQADTNHTAKEYDEKCQFDEQIHCSASLFEWCFWVLSFDVMQDVPAHIGKTLVDVPIGVAQHAHAILAEECVTLRIAFEAVSLVVLGTVNLDDKVCGCNVEISDVPAEDLLTVDGAGKGFEEAVPQAVFLRGHFAAKGLGEWLERWGVGFVHR